MSERDTARAVRDLLRVLGCWEHKPRAALGDRRGIPDILACYRGRFVAFEVKGPKGRLSPHQSLELAAIRAAGGIVGVVRSLEDAVRLLRDIEPDIDRRVEVLG